ncbi:unnamed protein product, partial [Phaeothamnion confervicola]
ESLPIVLVGLGYGKQRGFGKIEINAQLSGPVLLLPSRSFSTKGGLAAPLSMLFLQRACAEGPAERRHRFLLCLPLILHIGKCGSGGGSACSGGSRCAVIRWYWSEAQPCREQCLGLGLGLPRPAVLSDPLRAERPPQPHGGRVRRLRSHPRGGGDRKRWANLLLMLSLAKHRPGGWLQFGAEPGSG